MFSGSDDHYHSKVMKLNKEQLSDIRVAVTYYRNRQISAHNPRYQEFEEILSILAAAVEEYNKDTD